MVITAWIVFIISVGLIITHILLYKKNEAYHNRIKAIFKRKWTVVMGVLLFPILLYIIATSFLIMVQGDCFVGYYTVQKSQISYQDALYDRVTEEKEIDMLNDLDWTYINTEDFITLQPVRFPYFEYWMPHIFFDRLYIPVETKDYIVVTSLDGSSMYYELAQ